MNPYRQYIAEIARLTEEAKTFGAAQPSTPPTAAPAGAPVALIFAPHPDDECIVGGLALRLKRESGMRVVDVPVTLGSNPARRMPRLKELTSACAAIGFDIALPAPQGLERITSDNRKKDPAHWATSVAAITAILEQEKPRVVFCPHNADWNQSHIGTHHVVMDALAKTSRDFECFVFETEFWAAMANPNLMVESNIEDVADLVAAISLHIEEVARNPYHLALPAWMRDNVRRGAELVGGQGGAAPPFAFATLYRASRWSQGRLQPATRPRALAESQDPALLFL